MQQVQKGCLENEFQTEFNKYRGSTNTSECRFSLGTSVGDCTFCSLLSSFLLDLPLGSFWEPWVAPAPLSSDLDLTPLASSPDLAFLAARHGMMLEK
jgi:hypothetical protein